MLANRSSNARDNISPPLTFQSRVGYPNAAAEARADPVKVVTDQSTESVRNLSARTGAGRGAGSCSRRSAPGTHGLTVDVVHGRRSRQLSSPGGEFSPGPGTASIPLRWRTRPVLSAFAITKGVTDTPGAPMNTRKRTPALAVLAATLIISHLSSPAAADDHCDFHMNVKDSFTLAGGWQ